MQMINCHCHYPYNFSQIFFGNSASWNFYLSTYSGLPFFPYTSFHFTFEIGAHFSLGHQSLTEDLQHIQLTLSADLMQPAYLLGKKCKCWESLSFRSFASDSARFRLSMKTPFRSECDLLGRTENPIERKIAFGSDRRNRLFRPIRAEPYSRGWTSLASTCGLD